MSGSQPAFVPWRAQQEVYSAANVPALDRRHDRGVVEQRVWIHAFGTHGRSFLCCEAVLALRSSAGEFGRRFPGRLGSPATLPHAMNAGRIRADPRVALRARNRHEVSS